MSLNLIPEISGITKDSPVWLTGIRCGEVIRFVNEKKTALPRRDVEGARASRAPADRCLERWNGSKVFLVEPILAVPAWSWITTPIWSWRKIRQLILY